jgi:hypothetical protein
MVASTYAASEMINAIDHLKATVEIRTEAEGRPSSLCMTMASAYSAVSAVISAASPEDEIVQLEGQAHQRPVATAARAVLPSRPCALPLESQPVAWIVDNVVADTRSPPAPCTAELW